MSTIQLNSPQSALNAPPAEPARKKPELLAPAGDWECARAAVENGADAIYFGLERFNARMRAHNFSEADLPKLMDFLHSRGVRGYVTFNTLVFANELADAEHYLRSIISAGVDAAIVQDIGICRLIRRLSPDFPIHASTQMTVTSQAGVEFARDLGCNLVVLARECSLKEIEKIHLAEKAAAEIGAAPFELPLEVFVHGALCVAYSGQCLTSESLGGRSANRGECAQACRMPYELISDGKDVPLGDKRYLLSPQDLAGIGVLSDLVRSGVASLKIEGRLKTPEYVANITRVYRQALDKLSEAAPGSSDALDEMSRQLAKESSYDLEMGFSRGLHSGWFGGINNQQLVHARFGKKRGVYLGEVKSIRGEQVLLELKAPLKKGDGIVFDAGHPDQEEEGGRVYSVDQKGRETVLGFGRGDINFQRVHPGDKLWKTSDPELDRRVRQTFTGEQPLFRRPITIEAHGRPGQPLKLIARDGLGNVSQAESKSLLVPAEKHPLTTDRLGEQLGRLGGTPFELRAIENFLEGAPILPMSELNQLRRNLVADLDALRRKPKRWQLHLESQLLEISPPGKSPALPAELIVLVRSLPQLEAAMNRGVGTLYCEFEDPKKYREAVQIWRTSPDHSRNRTIWVAPPRIAKTGEEWILKQVLSSEADGYLVRNYDHLKFFAEQRRTGDFSLNIANPLTADYFKNRFGLERLTASYDLNFQQLEALIHSVPPEWLEVTIHQHMPMFHMEHCVFCAFLSKGTDFTNCGRPCDHHEVKLRDRAGAEHFLKADAGCRNTVFNAAAQTGAEYVSRMLTLGVRYFRIEFMTESPEQVAKTIAKYRQLLQGEISGADLWRELKLLNQLGVTRGQMEKAERRF
jgi:putative protease